MAITVTLTIPSGCLTDCCTTPCETCEACFGAGYSETYPEDCDLSTNYVDIQSNGSLTCYQCLPIPPMPCPPAPACYSGGTVTITGNIDYLNTVTINPDGSYSTTDTPYPGNYPPIPSSTDLTVTVSGCTQGTPSFSGSAGDSYTSDGCVTVVTLDDQAAPGGHFHSVTLTFPPGERELKSPKRPLRAKLLKQKALPGTELKRLLAFFRFREIQGCQCNSRATAMDRNGPQWCRKNIKTIVGWLGEEAAKRPVAKFLFNRLAAYLLVHWAIWKAQRKISHP